ncbi:MAG: hypothetical protein RL685_2630 [Pseudomonadota bacterium]
MVDHTLASLHVEENHKVSNSPPGFPLNIPISKQTFENWSQGIIVPDVWTAVPVSYDDVAAICNWAAGAGYQVRPRGIMHNWSPLTLTSDEKNAKVVLVDLTQKLNAISSVSAASAGQPPQVQVQTGATMLALMTALEAAPAGSSNVPKGFSFAHIPAPGNITVGGALAINAHGTAVPTPPNDNFNIPYGSLSNLILSFTAVVTDPSSATPTRYVVKTFQRGEGDDRAFLTHCGRAFLLDVTLQAIDNYYLRCQSIMTIDAATLFAAPATPTSPPPTQSVGHFLNQSGRVEVIWFPPLPSSPGAAVPTTQPWLKVWTVSPQRPPSSKAVTEPYNYAFSDNLPVELSNLLKSVIGQNPDLTPTLTSYMATFTSWMLFLGLTDLWGPSKDLLLYVKDSTLRVTANGYAVLMKKEQVQQAVADFTTQFVQLLVKYQNAKPTALYPINSPCEIRVTGLDDPSLIVTPSGSAAQSPVISSLSLDPVVRQNGWDVAVWFDVLTVLPLEDSNSQQAYEFYRELELWVAQHFRSGYRQMPEWSKGWAYTNGKGPWTDTAYIGNIKETLTTGRAKDDTWAWEVAALAKYDAANLFTNPFLGSLFT